MSVATRPLKRTGASVNLRMNPLPSAVFATGPYKPSCRPDGWRHSGSGHGSMDGAGIGTGERGRDIHMEGGGGAEGKGGKGHGRAGPCRTCATHDRKRCTGEKHKYRKMGNSTNGLTLAHLHLLGFVPVAAAAMANVWT